MGEACKPTLSNTYSQTVVRSSLQLSTKAMPMYFEGMSLERFHLDLAAYPGMLFKTLSTVLQLERENCVKNFCQNVLRIVENLQNSHN